MRVHTHWISYQSSHRYDAYQIWCDCFCILAKAFLTSALRLLTVTSKTYHLSSLRRVSNFSIDKFGLSQLKESCLFSQSSNSFISLLSLNKNWSNFLTDSLWRILYSATPASCGCVSILGSVQNRKSIPLCWTHALHCVVCTKQCRLISNLRLHDVVNSIPVYKIEFWLIEC